MLPLREGSLLDRDVLNWRVGQDKPRRRLLPAAALAAARATGKERQRSDATLAAMEALARPGHPGWRGQGVPPRHP